VASTLELLILAQLAEPPWTALTLINSWSNRGGVEVAAKYRYWALSNELEVIGTVSHASVSGTSQFCSTFTQYLPSSNTHEMAMEIVLAGLPNVQLYYQTSGVLEFASLPSGSTIVAFHARFPLDA
jgi:hypothetical protein